jgi:hypothetical protein
MLLFMISGKPISQMKGDGSICQIGNRNLYTGLTGDFNPAHVNK